MCNYLKSINIETTLIKIDDQSIKYEGFKDFTDFVIEVNDQEELISELKQNEFDLIFHRTWMHRYEFAARLLDYFENIIFYIKDWFEEMPQELYKFQYTTDEDYLAIKQLFLSNKKILSHYTDAYTHDVWSKKYNVPLEKFIFFPEYCSSNNFFTKSNILYDANSPKILYAGATAITCMPDDIVYGKSFLSSMLNITKQNIKLDMMILGKNYNRVFEEDLFKDYLYEHKFNDYFSLVKGSPLNIEQTNDYHFGLFQVLSPIINNENLKSTAYAYVSKFAYYMEAGIPILVHECFSVSKVVEEYNLGIVIKEKDLLNLNSILAITNDEYLSLVENVQLFRERFTYNSQTMKPILELLNE